MNACVEFLGKLLDKLSIKRRVEISDFYLAGPMRGYDDLNAPMFRLVSHLMREKGFTVWNPSEHGSYIKTSFAECMKEDLNAIINGCRNIAMLPGWRDSLGANIEACAAFACGKDAFEVVMWDNGASFDLAPVDLTKYVLPYISVDCNGFDPHNE